MTAVFAGEAQEANAILHPDGNVIEYSEEEAERNEVLNATIQSIEITEENENTATVSSVVHIENPENNKESTRARIYSLRIDDGSWKIYDSEEDEAA